MRRFDLTDFAAAGFCVVDAVVSRSMCDRLCATLAASLGESAGSRALLADPLCRELVVTLRTHVQIRHLLPPSAVAVQCTLFNKTLARNWLVPLHQDLSIPVRAQIKSTHCSGWSRKEGHWFAQPPSEVLDQLVAIRVHLDASTAENGPLRVVPGSHRFGRMTDAQADAQREESGETSVHASRGSALVMRPLLLHASSKAIAPTARRVLHFLFGPSDLPYGLEWADSV